MNILDYLQSMANPQAQSQLQQQLQYVAPQPENNGLQSLLASLAQGNGLATQATPQAAPASTGQDIVVNGQKPVDPSSMLNSTMADTNFKLPEATPEQLRQIAPLDNLPRHHGLFGVHGTLRDVLGTIGDAFLIQGGAKPIYAPTRQQERLGDAMVGWQNNPEDAAARTAMVSPAEGYKMSQDNITHQQADAVNQTNLKKIGATQDAERLKNYTIGGKQYGQAAQYLSKHPEAAASLVPYMAKLKEAYGLGDEFPVPDMNHPDQVAMGAFGGAAIPTTNQVSSTETARSHLVNEGIAQENADAHMKNADRPPAGRAAPNPTNAAMAAGLLGKVQRGEPLTQGQNEFLDRVGYGTSSKPKANPFARPATAPAAGGGKLVFRNGKLVPK